MRKLLLTGVVLLVWTAGCKKTENQAATGGSGLQPSGHGPTGVALSSGADSGSGGAAQAVRKAVMSTVTRHEMDNIRIFIQSASTGTGQMPAPEQVAAALQKESPKTWKLIQEGAIVLTGTRKRENVWAYTRETQNNGAHFIVTTSGIENISTPMLQQRLQQEQGQ